MTSSRERPSEEDSTNESAAVASSASARPSAADHHSSRLCSTIFCTPRERRATPTIRSPTCTGTAAYSSSLSTVVLWRTTLLASPASAFFTSGRLA